MGYVSCLCRAVLGKHARNPPGEYYEPMEAKSGETIWQTYNTAINHHAPFTEKDKING